MANLSQTVKGLPIIRSPFFLHITYKSREKLIQKKLSWQFLTLPGGRPPSTISGHALDCRVRYVAGYTHAPMVTNLTFLIYFPEFQYVFLYLTRVRKTSLFPTSRIKPSIISTGLLKPLLTFHLRPIKQVVSLRSYTFQSRELILKRVSHLDAFSGYLCRTWLLSGAPGGTTDTPEVRPPRSSRTRGSSSQFSFAHSG